MQTRTPHGRMTIERGIRRAAIAAGVFGAGLALAAGALAAKPKHGAHFVGRTSVPPVVGFRAPVKFTVSKNGRSLSHFTFGSFGCFGAGGFKQGVNPYTGSSLIDVGTVKVSAKGAISASGARSTSKVGGQTTVTTISISGRFSKAKAASGSITFSQSVIGSVMASCGPATVSFFVSAH